MFCNKCGKNNPDDAVFCMICGSKLNYIPSCKNCGKEIPEEAVFCPYCGSKQTEKDFTAESEICHTSVQPSYKSVSTVNRFSAEKVLSHIVNGLVLFLAAVALIFVVFTGISVSVPYGADFSEILAGGNEGKDFIYCFGDAFKDIGEVIDIAGTNMSDYFEADLYLNVVFGTLAGAVATVTVAVFSILAIVKGIAFYTGKGKGNGEIFAITAFIAYVCGAVAFKLLYGASIDYRYKTEILNFSTQYNSVTVAGIVLGALSVTAIAGLKIARNAKNILNVKNVKNIVMSAVGVVLIAVILGILGNSILSLNIKEMYTNFNAGINPLVILHISAGIELDNSISTSSHTPEGLISNLNGIMVLSVIVYIIMFALLVFLAINFMLKMKSLINGRQAEEGGLTYSVLIFILSVVALVLNIVLCNMFEEVIKIISAPDKVNLNIGYTTLICAVVFSVFNLASCIAHKIICKEKPSYEQIMMS